MEAGGNSACFSLQHSASLTPFLRGFFMPFQFLIPNWQRTLRDQ